MKRGFPGALALRHAVTAERPRSTPAMATRGETPAALTRAQRLFALSPVTVALWVMFAVYVVFYVAVEWLRYHDFLMHALDMGNMEQAVWNTAHGFFNPPFQFNNLEQKWHIEAAGTNTRLSFHVEPILLLMAIPYLVHSSPVNLMVIQELVVASGVFPAAWLARRHLRSHLAQVVFPLAYLLSPALEAATLYEFHAVTLSAALLLWALYFADGKRYLLFALFALLAMGTKEEIGLVVAMMGLWIWWRHRARTIGLTAAILGVGWTLFCFLVIMRHFHHGHTSPYCARLNPAIINGFTADPANDAKSCTQVAGVVLHHPDWLLGYVFMTQKLGFLHRMLVTTGYLSLLSPLTLAVSLPSYGIILLSNDVHMYSGLAHYSAELVPILIGSSILGVSWLAFRVAPRLRLPSRAVVTVACLWLLVASLSNARINGFTPLSENWVWPQETYHVQVGHRILAEIPPGASVAAGDFLNAHLSDRHDIYLFNDVNQAQYAVVDVSRDNFPLSPYDEWGSIQCMLNPQRAGCDPNSTNGSWGIKDAQDGYILLERRAPSRWGNLPYDPHLSTTLPPAFYSFIVPPQPVQPPHQMKVKFGPSLQLVGYKVERREEINLRTPDVLVTTYWERTGPITAPITPVVYLTNSAGAIDQTQADHPAIDWLPVDQWPLNKIVTLQTVSMSLATNQNGTCDIDLAVYRSNAQNLLTDDAHVYRPVVLNGPDGSPMEVVARGTILKLAQVTAHW